MLGPSASTVTGGGVIGNAAVQSGPGYGKNYCGTSFGLLECVTQWATASATSPTAAAAAAPVAPGKWDVIHFNWGLHDICPKMYVAVALEQYVANMEDVYVQLKNMLAADGTIIWATTTPVPPSYKNRNNTDVVAANAAMRTLFGPGGKHTQVIVHDLYSEVVRRWRAVLRGSMSWPLLSVSYVLSALLSL